MMSRSFFMAVLVLFLPAHVLFARETESDNLSLGLGGTPALRDLVIDETIRRLALKDEQAQRAVKDELALRDLVIDETLYRLTAKTQRPPFFFTPWA